MVGSIHMGRQGSSEGIGGGLGFERCAFQDRVCEPGGAGLEHIIILFTRHTMRGNEKGYN